MTAQDITIGRTIFNQMFALAPAFHRIIGVPKGGILVGDEEISIRSGAIGRNKALRVSYDHASDLYVVTLRQWKQKQLEWIDLKDERDVFVEDLIAACERVSGVYFKF